MRSKRAALNIISKFAYQIVAMICGLITPRLILGAFGSTYNGAVSSITQFLSMISILTIGLAGATRVELYKTLAKDDILGTSRIIKATDKYMHKVGAAFIAYALVLAIVYPIIVKGELPWVETALLVAILGIATFAQYFFGLTYSTLLQADQTEYIYTLLQLVANICNTLIAVVLIKTGASIFVVKLASSSLFAIVPIVLRIYVRKKYRLIADCEADESALKQRSSAMFHSIANIIHDNTDVLLLTLFTDVKTISVYTVYYIVVKNIKSVMQNFVTGLEAAFGNMWARKEFVAFKKNFETYEFLVVSFSSVVFTCVGLLLVEFIRLYTSGISDVNYIRYDFAILVTVAEGVFCIRQPYITIVQAAGKYRETRNGAMVEALINLIISLVLVQFIGLNGVIVGTLIANVFRTTQYALYSSKELLDRRIFAFWKICAWHVLNTCIIVGVFSLVCRISINDWISWLFCGFIAFLIAMIVTMSSAYVFYRSQLIHAFHILKKMVWRNR